MLDLTTRWNALMARKIVAVSEQTKLDLTTDYRVRSSKITVVHSGVSHDRFLPVDAVHMLSLYGLKQPYILFLSTVHPRKNVTRLVEAFEALDEDNVSLVIAGKPGWLNDPIEERIRSSVRKDRIHRLGYVADDDVPALYSGASVFALPSLFEGFGMGILEAMACGCPVVTSNCSSMPEVADGAAILVDPYDVASIRDGLTRALNPAERGRFTLLGLDRSRRATWEETARQTMSVIASAMSARRRHE